VPTATMINRYPQNRRKFLGEWDHILYLYDKVLYWFYERHCRARALHFCELLEHLLKLHAANHQAIKGEECWSLIFEIRGDLRNAIKHREREIRLIKRLQKIGKGTTGYQPSDLADRLDLLDFVR
jgi:hypothetical protein